VAPTFGRAHVQAGDEIGVSEMEHHSNIVPWQMLCEEKARAYASFDQPTRATPARRVRAASRRTHANRGGHARVKRARHHHPVDRSSGSRATGGIAVLIDGPQAVAHMPVDVQAIGCDFYVFSATSSSARQVSACCTPVAVVGRHAALNQGGGT